MAAFMSVRPTCGAGFSSPCSGNYVKHRQHRRQRWQRRQRVFVPLFGELCKTGLCRYHGRRGLAGTFSSPCSGNYVKHVFAKEQGFYSAVEFSSPCSGNYVKPYGFRFYFTPVPRLFSSPCSGNYVKLHRNARCRRIPASFRPLVRGTM